MSGGLFNDAGGNFSSISGGNDNWTRGANSSINGGILVQTPEGVYDSWAAGTCIGPNQTAKG